jgi:hypothetical protein
MDGTRAFALVFKKPGTINFSGKSLGVDIQQTFTKSLKKALA